MGSSYYERKQSMERERGGGCGVGKVNKRKPRYDLALSRKYVLRRMIKPDGLFFSAVMAWILIYVFVSEKVFLRRGNNTATSSLSLVGGGGVQENWRILCCIELESESDYNVGSKYILDSWGYKCDKFIFFGWKENVLHIPHEKVVEFNEQGENKKGKIAHRSWKFIYNNYLQEYDFFMKAEIRTYMFMENYFDFTKRLHPDIPLYFGKQLKVRGKSNKNFISDASISLSRAALQRLGRAMDSPDHSTECSEQSFISHGGEMDVALSECLWSMGIFSLDTRDEYGRERFMVSSPDDMFFGEVVDWYKQMSYNAIKGIGCCSDKPIAFHIDDVKDLSHSIVLENDVWKMK